ncbi:hypothetical protein MNEG_13359 [Monoraphidium neglectum]|uniref:DUF7148 domain-containing protein n=1 Tax=Monoraphidium neglectum TaxID=145388 RepID=A0A0D2J3W9_9CHLO|nr:hypothetical protein MNEG_13359 [Monoraphidium neglectum]KIY94602.1 hypothetical protein MNEG_13359 [Monoraphidium neglectum]|eukprot:XP_013893622.1 hypothetical protein MNEG_13359 [Monoraphidium neglectum]
MRVACKQQATSANEEVFTSALYQHVATLTQNGVNLPFVLPLKVDRLADGGFQIGLLRRGDSGTFGSAVDIVGVVESVEDGGDLHALCLDGPPCFSRPPRRRQLP